ncbi:hypothetical protein [Clostridium manihotivorum]|uniref:YcxB-like protein domain-containing protein n=1 Tax=Clostridium manihotivorum TaxID=2320868 RepID=A0A410DZ31_9CLOT|nr:hypothetical protein [Clostridium manihotivorum]QAA34333.1 hypothetical protein C1I91_23320 [Clostridium manihotivorum]
MQLKYTLSILDKLKITNFLLKRDSSFKKSYGLSIIVKQILLIYMIPILYKTFLIAFVGAEKNRSLEYHIVEFFKNLFESFFVDIYSLISITVIYLLGFIIWRMLLISFSQRTAINNYVNTLYIDEAGIKLQNNNFTKSVNITYIKEILITNGYLYIFGDNNLLFSVIPVNKIIASKSELNQLLQKHYKSIVKEVY